MIGSVARHDAIERYGLPLTQRPFLQEALGILDELGAVGEAALPQAHDQRARRLEAAVEIHGAEDRLHHIAQNERLGRHALRLLLLANPDVIGDAEIARCISTGFGTHQQAEILGKRPFRLARIADIEFLGNDDAQNAVAEKFKALIGRVGLALAAAAMSERRLEEIAAAEGVAEECRDRLEFRFGEARPVGGHGLNSRD
jgi:hypothetical protein